MFIFTQEKTPAERRLKAVIIGGVVQPDTAYTANTTRQRGRVVALRIGPPQRPLIRGAVRDIRQGYRPRLGASQRRRPLSLAGGADLSVPRPSRAGGPSREYRVSSRVSDVGLSRLDSIVVRRMAREHLQELRTRAPALTTKPHGRRLDPRHVGRAVTFLRPGTPSRFGLGGRVLTNGADPDTQRYRLAG